MPLPATDTLKRLGVQGVIAPPSQIVKYSVAITPQSFSDVYKRLNAINSNGRRPQL